MYRKMLTGPFFRNLAMLQLSITHMNHKLCHQGYNAKRQIPNINIIIPHINELFNYSKDHKEYIFLGRWFINRVWTVILRAISYLSF